MIRIIYLKQEIGYCQADVKIKKELDLKVASLQRYGAEIICIFEVGVKSILYKSSSFDIHIEHIKASYPSTFPGKLLNMLSANQKPSYSQITALEQQSKILATKASSENYTSSTAYSNILHVL